MSTKQKKQKQKKPAAQAPIALPETRQALMLMAKDRGIKNFRVLNKAELAEVLTDGVTPERIQEVVAGAVSRWKAGWGTKKKAEA
ncbi:MAG: hypothetical protein HQL12_04845 [Candidatus Omnitrophica bacterium]|nr:hypothetical protein [Candidatus Omnitrophota bacterium]